MQTVIFSDLDGCLLDKQTYSFAPAISALERAKQLGIPVVLASSKTEPEMLRIASEMNLAPAPIICENGGAILWNPLRPGRQPDAAQQQFEKKITEQQKTVLGVSRQDILEVLGELKAEYKFRSFQDLGVDGIAEATGLDLQRAAQAADRSATEPLLWDDEDDAINAFRKAVQARGLTLTRGGRFWHLAGQTTKGAAMLEVIQQCFPSARSLAIGDSPIDQSMLDVASVPIGIPQPNGEVLVTVTENGLIADSPGPTGWAESVEKVISD